MMSENLSGSERGEQGNKKKPPQKKPTINPSFILQEGLYVRVFITRIILGGAFIHAVICRPVGKAKDL